MRRTLAKEKKADASITAEFDSLTIGGLTPLTGGSGSSSSLSYQLGPAASFSSAQAKFGTKSLYLPRSNSTGLTIEGLSESNFSGAWTIEFWLYPLAFPTGSAIILSTTSATGSYIEAGLGSSGAVSFSGMSNNVSINSIVTAGTMSLNAWNHVSFGYNGSNRYFASVNGTLTQSSITATTLNWSLIGTRFHFGSYYTISGFSDFPSFILPINGFIDEIRFSNTQRYTANFTPSTTAFVSDSLTFFLHHCESLLSQDAPTMTSTSTSVDSSGSIVTVGDLSSKIGNISLTTGSISTSRGSLGTYRDVMTATPSWRIGPSAILAASSAISSTTTVGCYRVCGAWSTSNASSVLIRAELFLMNSLHGNAMGVFTIYTSSKASGGTKMGIIRGDYILSGGTATFYTISTTKSSGLTTFSVGLTSTSLNVSTDSDCRVSWCADMCL